MVGQGLPTLVRVDKEYPYGDADDAWKEAATAVGQSDAKVLIANIGVADPPSPYRGEEYRGEYGGGPEDEDFDENAWRENQDLAERFSVSLEAFPKYFFFPADWKDGVKLATTLESGQRVIITPPNGSKPGTPREFNPT